MAVKQANIDFLVRMRNGRTGGKMLTLGRQHWCGNGKKHGERQFADDIFKKELKLDFVESIDISAEDNPTYKYDLTQSLPLSFLNQYDLVYDGGTLEHCYDVLAAFENVANLIKIGGQFVSHQILNLTGHGFWTLSPELFTKWATKNGFHNMFCEVYRLGPFARKYPVNLKDTQKRIEFTSFVPINMHFGAEKRTSFVSFENPIQAGPSLTSTLKYWLYETRTWGKS